MLAGGGGDFNSWVSESARSQIRAPQVIARNHLRTKSNPHHVRRAIKEEIDLAKRPETRLPISAVCPQASSNILRT